MITPEQEELKNDLLADIEEAQEDGMTFDEVQEVLAAVTAAVGQEHNKAKASDPVEF